MDIFYNYDRTTLRGYLDLGPTQLFWSVGPSSSMCPTRIRSLQSANLLGEWKGKLFAMAEVSLSVLWRKEIRVGGGKTMRATGLIPYLER